MMKRLQAWLSTCIAILLTLYVNESITAREAYNAAVFSGVGLLIHWFECDARHKLVEWIHKVTA